MFHANHLSIQDVPPGLNGAVATLALGEVINLEMLESVPCSQQTGDRPYPDEPVSIKVIPDDWVMPGWSISRRQASEFLKIRY